MVAATWAGTPEIQCGCLLSALCSEPATPAPTIMAFVNPNSFTGRFNERMVLSLASCPNCLLMDDELNVLPTSSLIR